MSKLFLLFLFFMSMGSLYSMDKPLPLAPHNPELAAPHERALRGFKRSNTRHMQMLRGAITYFEATDHPDREFLLRQCEACKIIIAHYEPKIQKKFTALLAEELKQPAASRWEKIKKVLPVDTSIALHPDEQLMSKLIVLAHDSEQSHDKWIGIITPPAKTEHVTEEFCDDQEDESEESEEEPAPTEQNAVLPQQVKKLVKAKVDRPLPKRKNKKSGKKKGKKTNPQRLANKRREAISGQFWAALDGKLTDQAIQLLRNHTLILDANMRHEKLGTTPLQVAVMKEDVPTCIALLAAGAKPNARCGLTLHNGSVCEMPTLGLAIQAASVPIAMLLLKANADPNAPIVYKTAPEQREHLLCIAGSEMAEDETAYTPEKQEQMIRLLLLYGAKAPCKSILLCDKEHNSNWSLDLNDKKHTGAMPLILATTEKIRCTGNIIQLIAYPKSMRALLHAMSATVRELLWHAFETHDDDQVPTLIAQMKDPQELTASPAQQLSLFHYCAANNKQDACMRMIDQGAKPNSAIEIALKDDNNESYTVFVTPLMLTIVHGFVELGKKLIARGADPNQLMEQPVGEKEYPLCVAVGAILKSQEELRSTRKHMLAMLLRNGATHFNGNVFLVNSAMNTTYRLDLHDADDQECIQNLLNTKDEFIDQLLECAEDTITFRVNVKIPDDKLARADDLSDDVEFTDSTELLVDEDDAIDSAK